MQFSNILVLSRTEPLQRNMDANVKSAERAPPANLGAPATVRHKIVESSEKIALVVPIIMQAWPRHVIELKSTEAVFDVGT